MVGMFHCRVSHEYSCEMFFIGNNLCEDKSLRGLQDKSLK